MADDDKPNDEPAKEQPQKKPEKVPVKEVNITRSLDPDAFDDKG